MGHHHKATIHWERKDADFLKGRYSREHTWSFDGGFTMPASSSPSVVPTPWSNPACVDPEEAFVAAISSCHMLTFIYLAGKQGFQIDRYHDEAIGEMAKSESGKYWISIVHLNPQITYSGPKIPSPEQIEKLNHAAHLECFIANSVKTEIRIEARGQP